MTKETSSTENNSEENSGENRPFTSGLISGGIHTALIFAPFAMIGILVGAVPATAALAMGMVTAFGIFAVTNFARAFSKPKAEQKARKPLSTEDRTLRERAGKLVACSLSIFVGVFGGVALNGKVSTEKHNDGRALPSLVETPNKVVRSVEEPKRIFIECEGAANTERLTAIFIKSIRQQEPVVIEENTIPTGCALKFSL